MSRATQRHLRIDAFRLYAIAMVVWAHVQLFGNLDPGWPPSKVVALVVVMAARYTMPYFFILAGYFIGGKIIRDSSNAFSITRAYTGKLAVIFLFWCLIYALEQPQAFLSLVSEHPLNLLLEGSRVHLWFLVSMILTVWLFQLWPWRRSAKSFLLLGVVLYVIGMLGGPYKSSPIGLDLGINTRDGVFFSVLFFAVGVMLRDGAPRVSKKLALGMALTGFAVFVLEAGLLRMKWGLSPLCHDYLLGTVLFGVGMSLYVLSQPDSPLDTAVGRYGRYTLGIYTSHLLFVDLLAPVGRSIAPAVWQVLFPCLVLALSLLTGVMLARTPLRRMVM